MNKWFQKGNARRFHRIDMPTRTFIVPSSPITDRDIYATGANYFPKGVRSKLEATRFNVQYSLDKIQDQKELINTIFNSAIADIEFFGNCLEQISTGMNPKQDPNYWIKIKEKQKGFISLEQIKNSSPKTHQYLALIEAKYLIFLTKLIYSIEHSTTKHFAVEGRLPVGFKIDELSYQFKSEKFAKIPLIQAILHLYEYMEAYLDVFRNINDDNYLRQFPQEWPLKKSNVSASGIATLLSKRFELYTRVDVLVYFEHAGRTLYFEGTVVDIREDEHTQKERVAINFEFPDGKDQLFLQQQIEKQEVKECMKFNLYS